MASFFVVVFFPQEQCCLQLAVRLDSMDLSVAHSSVGGSNAFELESRCIQVITSRAIAKLHHTVCVPVFLDALKESER